MTEARRVYDIFLKETTAKRSVVLDKGGPTTTLRLFKARPVRAVELPAASAFHAGGALLLPEAPDGVGSPLAVLAEVLRFLGAHPEHSLLVAAHGADEALTAAQAKSVLAALTGDVAAWTEVATAVGRPDDRAAMEAWASGRAGGAAAGDWGALLARYDDELARLLGVDLAALAARRAALRLVERPSIGCGAEWPIARARVLELPSVHDARVDLLAFAPDDLPLLKCHEGPACAPKVCDLYRKGKYQAQPLVPLERKGIVRGLLTGMFFDTDKTLLLPRAMKGIKQLRRYYERNPGSQLLVVGHTDTSGRPDYNLPLSDDRAAALAAYLRDDVEAWTRWYDAPKESKRWGTREDQHLLSALPDGGPFFFQGEVDGKADAETKAAIEAFQRFANERRGAALKVDGLAGPKTRAELVRAYMELDGTSLPAGTVLLTHGCGEFHPEVATGDEVALEANRRVEVFFFPEQVDPPPQATCPDPGCPEYAVWRLRTVLTIDLTLEPGSLEVLVTNREDGAILDEADVELGGFDPRTGKTDAAGLLRFDELFPGPYELVARKEGFKSGVAGVLVAPGGGAKAKTAPPGPKKSSFVEGLDEAKEADAGAAGDAAEGPLPVPLDPLPATLTALRGPEEAQVKRAPDPYAKAKLAPTTKVSALHHADALRVMRDDELPAPLDALVVRVQPGAKKDRTLTIKVLGQKGVLRTLTFDESATPLVQGRFDARFVCVWGKAEKDAPPLALEGLRTLDVSDPQADGTEGFATSLEVSGLGLPAQTLALELLRPRIVRFVGFAVAPDAPLYTKTPKKEKDVGPSTEVVVQQGWTVRLEWTVLGPFDELTLDPLGQALAKEPTGSVVVDPAQRRPGPGGAYSLVATKKKKGAPAAATVTTIGITGFSLRSLDPKKHSLHQVDNFKFHPTTGEKLSKEVEALPGRAGTWRRVPSLVPGLQLLGSPNLENVWYGHVLGTLEPPALLEWSVVGPDDLQLEVDVHALKGDDGKAAKPFDVSAETREQGGSGSLELKGRFTSSTMTYFEVDLSLWRAGAAREPGKRVACSVVRLRLDRPMPKIADGADGFSLFDGSDRVTDGAAVSGWEHLHARWKLGGDYKFNRYRLRVVEKGEEKKKDPTVLAELDLKPVGSFTSSGDTAFPPKPAALAGKNALVAIADLVRPPTKGEREKGAKDDDWISSANGPAGRRQVTFVLTTADRFPCVDMGDTCPVNTALDLRRRYLESLERLEAVRKKYAIPLRAAYFTKAVVEKVTDPKSKSPIDPAKAWKNVRGASGADGTEATGYSTSFLRADLERMEAEIAAAVAAAEKAAATLIDFISSPVKKFKGKGTPAPLSFQEHLLLKAHTEHTINEGNAALAEKLYGVGAPATFAPDQLVYRHIDHLCALFTDSMHATEIGTKFLTSLFDEGQLKKDQLAFDNVWEWAGKLNNITEPVGKFFYNVLMVHQNEVRLWSATQLDGFIMKKLLPGGPLQKFADLYDKKINAKGFRYNFKDIFYIRSARLTFEKGPALKEKIKTNSLHLVDVEKFSETVAGKAEAADGAWFNLAVDALALVVACQKFANDWKGEGTKNTISILKELFGTLKSAAELAEGRILSRGATGAEATLEAEKFLATRATNVTRVVKVCGTLACLCGAVLSLMDAWEGFQSKDWDKVVLHSAAAVASIVAIFFPGIGFLLAIAIAIVMEIVFDPPLIDWLEDTPWGEDAVFKYEEVIDKFFEALFDIDAYLKHTVSDDSNHDAIVIVSALLNPEVEISVTVTKGAPPETKKFTVKDKAIGGKGFVSWPHQNVEGKPRVHLHRAWEVFPTIVRDGSDHEVKVELRPPETDKAPLKVTRTMAFRRPPTPRLEMLSTSLWGLREVEQAGRLKKRPGSRAIDPFYVVLDTQTVPIVVQTRYADGCQVKVELWEPGIFVSDRLGFTTAKVVDKTAGTSQPGSVDTRVELVFPITPPDEDIELRLEAYLYPPGVDPLARPDDHVSDKLSMSFRAAKPGFVAKPM